MPLLSSSEVAAMRATCDGTLPDRCAIERPVLSQNDIGEMEETFSPVGTGIECRLAPATQKALADFGAQALLVANWVLTLEYDEDLQEGDRVTINPHVFRVVAVNKDYAWQLCLRAALVAMEPVVN